MRRAAKNARVEDRFGHIYELSAGEGNVKNGHFFNPLCLLTCNRYVLFCALLWHESQHKDPLFLISTMDGAREIMNAYRKRFGIETLFADIKSRGFHIQKKDSKPLK